MCFGGKKQPQQEPLPTPAPAPQIIEPSNVSSLNPTDDIAKRRKRLQRGLASTIKTSGKGITGSGPDLISPSLGGKSKVGS